MFGRLVKWFRGNSLTSKGVVDSPFAAPLPQANRPESQAEAPPEADPELTEPPAQSTATGEFIKLSWNSVLKQVPAEFLKRSAQQTLVRGAFCLGKKAAIQQLPQGSVKVPLAEIRRAAPSGIFVESDKGDQQLIALPLRDILRRLRPEVYGRRPNQSRVEVPESVMDLFGPRGQALSEVRILRRGDLRKTGSTGTATTAPFSGKEINPGRKTPAAPAPPQADPVPRPSVAPNPIAVPDTLRLAMQLRTPSLPGSEAVPGRQTISQASPVAPASAPLPGLPRIGQVPAQQGIPHWPPPNPTPIPGHPAPLPPSGPGARPPGSITVPLADISGHWPEFIRQEIAKLRLETSQCQIPIGEITAAVKQGRVFFPWQKIRSWLQPSPPLEHLSSYGEAELEIPLQAVVPSFLQGRATPAPRGPQPAAPDIEDLFSRKPGGPPQIRPVAERAWEAEAAPHISEAPQPSAAADASGPNYFVIPLETVTANWPGPILQEIQRLNLQQAQLEIPWDVLEQDLKKGRIEHCWIQICSWIPGFPSSADTSHHANVRIELPLSIIAPQFLKERQAPSARKSYVPSEIPDLFSAAHQPAGSVAATTGPAPVKPVAAEAPPQPRTPEPPLPAPDKRARKKSSGNVAELFGEPRKRNWTPNEIVHKTAGMEGVAGALIALQDGLLVAACMPPEWKSDTVAAFLPQMFGRMKQYARELNVGEIRSLTIAVEKGSLQVFNAGLIYFCVLGFPDRTLPQQELMVIATELSRHTK